MTIAGLKNLDRHNYSSEKAWHMALAYYWPKLRLAARELEIRRGDGIHAPDWETQLVEWTERGETWLTGDDVLVTLGDPLDGCSCDKDCDCHDCDSMGCGSFSHVVKREPKITKLGGVH